MRNNPLTLIDPSGFSEEEAWRLWSNHETPGQLGVHIQYTQLTPPSPRAANAAENVGAAAPTNDTSTTGTPPIVMPVVENEHAFVRSPEKLFPCFVQHDSLPSPAMANQPPTHTWISLLALVAPPTTADAELYAVELPSTDLVERGANIRSEKILTDIVRIASQAAEFWDHAETTQKRNLLGFSWPLLQVLVHSGKKLADMVATRDTHHDEREANRAAAFAIADETYKQGMDERDRLVVALEAVESLSPGLEARIAAARATVHDHDSLANSLHALIKLGRELLSAPQSRVARQLTDGSVTTAELNTLETLAIHIKSAGEQASGARTQGKVSQSDLDLQDGTCLVHLERVMRIFNRAHERDASIPRLLPIATRRMFAFATSRKNALPLPPETPESATQSG